MVNQDKVIFMSTLFPVQDKADFYVDDSLKDLISKVIGYSPRDNAYLVREAYIGDPLCGAYNNIVSPSCTLSLADKSVTIDIWTMIEAHICTEIAYKELTEENADFLYSTRGRTLMSDVRCYEYSNDCNWETVEGSADWDRVTDTYLKKGQMNSPSDLYVMCRDVFIREFGIEYEKEFSELDKKYLNEKQREHLKDIVLDLSESMKI